MVGTLMYSLFLVHFKRISFMELININILTLFQVSPFCVLSRTHDKVIRDALRKSGWMENSCDEKDKDNLLEGT